MSKVIHYIHRNRQLKLLSLMAIFLFSLLTLNIFIPLDNRIWGENNSMAATSSVAEPTLTLTATSSTASLNLLVQDAAGTLATSADNGTNAAFSVYTNNFTGYTLNIKSSSFSTELTGDNGGSFTSISDASGNGVDASSIGNGYWAYLPSKYNSAANTKYRPSPTSSGSTIAATSAAGTDDYTIGIAAKADYSKVAGTYSNTYTLTAVVNGFDYKMIYNKGNTTDTVNGLPATQSATSSSATYVSLRTDVPTRTGYTFSGWCEGPDAGVITTTDGVDSCSGTSYRTGTSHTTNPTYYFNKADNNTTINLYAMWTINS